MLTDENFAIAARGFYGRMTRMKKFGKWLGILGLGVAVLLCVMLTGSMLQRGGMRERGALTSARLDSLAANWEKSRDSRAAGRDVAKGAVAVEAAISDAPVAPERPALMRTFSSEQLAWMAQSRREQNSQVYEKASFEFCALLATLFSSIGIEDGKGFYLYDAGRVADHNGDFETAKLYYSEALQYPLAKQQRQRCCLSLAKICEDAALANQLLEVACPPGEDSLFLLDTVEFAVRVGDEALFNHYVAELRRHQPKFAAEIADMLAADARLVRELSRKRRGE